LMTSPSTKPLPYRHMSVYPRLRYLCILRPAYSLSVETDYLALWTPSRAKTRSRPNRSIVGLFEAICRWRSVTPDTILRWYRTLVAKKYAGSHRRRPGRPRTKADLAALSSRMRDADELSAQIDVGRNYLLNSLAALARRPTRSDNADRHCTVSEACTLRRGAL